MRRQPVAPFPGPSTGSSTEHVDQAGDTNILSPASSVFSSQSSTTSIISGGDHEQESHDKSRDKSNADGEHDTTTFEVEVEITGVDEDVGHSNINNARRDNIGTINANEQLLNGGHGQNGTIVKTREKEEEERVGSPQDVAKIEAFHDNLAYHFSTILLSENATEVVSSAQ